MQNIKLYLSLACLCSLPARLTAAPVVLNFDSLLDNTAVRLTYSGLGVTFSKATAITAGISLNEFEFPPYSGTNVVFDETGAIEITFSMPQNVVSGRFTYLLPITMTAFDLGGLQVGSALSLFTSNILGSGDAGSAPNELLTISGPSILSLKIEGDPTGSSFTLDDFAFEAVPEPGTFGLIFGALVLLHFRARGRGE